MKLNVFYSLTKKISLLFLISFSLITQKVVAQVVYHDIRDTTIVYPPIPHLGDSTLFYDLDINQDGIVDFKFRLNQWQIWRSPNSQPLQHVSQIIAEDTNQVLYTTNSAGPFCLKSLTLGDTIQLNDVWSKSVHPILNHGDIYVSALYSYYACNSPYSDKYYGIQFNIGTSVHIGWIHVDANAMGEVTLKGYAYNTIPNQMIFAGDTIPPISTSIENQSIEKDLFFQLYPIPFSDVLNIKLNDLKNSFQVTLSDVVGRKVKAFTINSALYSLDLSDIKNGVYFISLEDESGRVMTERVIKN